MLIPSELISDVIKESATFLAINHILRSMLYMVSVSSSSL